MKMIIYHPPLSLSFFGISDFPITHLLLLSINNHLMISLTSHQLTLQPSYPSPLLRYWMRL